MFEASYEMSATPFTRIPSHELYMPPELEEVENRLKYVAERQLFAVPTGDCGTGKTSILRRFVDDLDANRQLHEEIEIMRAVNGIQPVCVCDECHLMNREMLEEIRFLLNTHLDSKSPM